MYYNMYIIITLYIIIHISHHMIVTETYRNTSPGRKGGKECANPDMSLRSIADAEAVRMNP